MQIHDHISGDVLMRPEKEKKKKLKWKKKKKNNVYRKWLALQVICTEFVNWVQQFKCICIIFCLGAHSQRINVSPETKREKKYDERKRREKKSRSK